MIKYYIIVKSWWEIFPNNEKIRFKRRISTFFYTSKKEAEMIAAKLRKKDHYYRYDLGDRIYVTTSLLFTNKIYYSQEKGKQGRVVQ